MRGDRRLQRIGREAEKALAPLLKESTSRPLQLDEHDSVPSDERVVRSLFPEGPPVEKWKGEFVKSLPDEAIETPHPRRRPTRPASLSLMTSTRSTAPCTVWSGATAWNTRDATFSMVIAGSTPIAQADALKRWGPRVLESDPPVQPGEGPYTVNFMMDDEADGVQASYGDNFARLALVKAKYEFPRISSA